MLITPHTVTAAIHQIINRVDGCFFLFRMTTRVMSPSGIKMATNHETMSCTLPSVSYTQTLPCNWKKMKGKGAASF